VGAPGSVFHFDGEKWSRKRLDGLPTILAIAETPDQHVWFLHQNGLIEFDGNAWVDHPFWQRSAGRLFSPKSLQVDSKGILWIGASQGLYQLKDEGIEAVSLPHHGELLSFILDAEDHPWLGESYGGVYHDTGQGWDHLILAGEVASNYILTTAVDRDGSVWVGTDRGVSILAGGAWATFTTEDGMVDDHILSIAVSEVTGIWFGTENGVSNYAGTRWRSYTVADGRTGGRVASIAALPDGSVWFVTRRGLSRFAGGQISLSPYSSLSGQEVRAVSAGPDGILWALTGESLSRFDGNRFFMVKLPDPGLNAALGVTKSGDVWVGSTRGGLSKLDRSLWDQFSVNNTDAASIGADGVVKLVSGGQERTLAGSYFRTYTVEDGLPSNAIRAIGISEEDTVWAATDQGVAVLTAEDRFAPSAIPGLAEAGVWSISVDPMGQAWLGATQGGLVRLEPTR
jgi:ligand-binding sensor domain-containing protein